MLLLRKSRLYMYINSPTTQFSLFLKPSADLGAVVVRPANKAVTWDVSL